MHKKQHLGSLVQKMAPNPDKNVEKQEIEEAKEEGTWAERLHKGNLKKFNDYLWEEDLKKEAEDQ